MELVLRWEQSLCYVSKSASSSPTIKCAFVPAGEAGAYSVTLVSSRQMWNYSYYGRRPHVDNFFRPTV